DQHQVFVKWNIIIKKCIHITFVALRIYISFQVGSNEDDLFTSLLDQMLGSMVSAFIIINDNFSTVAFFFHTVEEDHGYSFFFKKAVVFKALGIKGKRGDQSIDSFMK